MEQTGQRMKPKYDLGLWFQQSWDLFRAHIWEFVLLVLVFVIPEMIVGLPVGISSYLEASKHPNPSGFSLFPTGARIAIQLAATLLGAAISTPVVVGVSAVALGVVRNGVFNWNLIWTGFRKWPASFAIGLISGALNSLPSLFPFLWIVFPVWLAVGLWATLAIFALTEPGGSFTSAINKPLALIRGNFWIGSLFLLVAVLTGGIGIIGCCVGVNFTFGYYEALLAVAYNDLTRQMAVPSPSAAEAAS